MPSIEPGLVEVSQVTLKARVDSRIRAKGRLQSDWRFEKRCNGTEAMTTATWRLGVSWLLSPRGFGRAVRSSTMFHVSLSPVAWNKNRPDFLGYGHTNSEAREWQYQIIHHRGTLLSTGRGLPTLDPWTLGPLANHRGRSLRGIMELTTTCYSTYHPCPKGATGAAANLPSCGQLGP